MAYPKEIQKSIDKIDSVYDRVQSMRGGTNQIAFNNAGKAPSNGTIETYRNEMRAFMNWANDKHGITDIGKIKERHGKEYVQEKIDAGKSTFSILKIPHALSSFATASKATGVFSHECRVINKDKVLGSCHDQGIVRKSEFSTRLMATDKDYQKVSAELAKSGSRYAGAVSDMHHVQRTLGFRIHEVVKMQVSDIQAAAKGIEARVQGKGGLEGYQKTDDARTLAILNKYCDGKKPGAFVFTVHDKKGNPKSHNELEKIAKKEISAAADRAGVNRDGKKYTTHSGRRAYAQEKMDGYAKMSVTQLRKTVQDRITHDKNGKWLERKYNTALNTIRAKFKDSAKAAAREMNKKELCSWLTSIDLRHGRLDIVRYYARYPKK